ncbi:hypothetical protein P3S67_022561 [Capsicum chacoense]
MDLSPVHHFHRANSLSHPIEERQNLLKETSMGSPTMDNTTDAKESTVKTNNIREAELSSSSFSSKTQLNTMPVVMRMLRIKVEDSPNHGVLTLTACLDGGLPWFHNVWYSMKTMETNMVPMVTIPYHGKPPSKQAVREVQVSFNENRAGNGSIWCRSNLSTGPGLQDEVVL